jgi:hypothetical protein
MNRLALNGTNVCAEMSKNTSKLVDDQVLLFVFPQFSHIFMWLVGTNAGIDYIKFDTYNPKVSNVLDITRASYRT